MQQPILSAMLSCQGLYLTDKEKYLFNKYNPIGVTLFNRNISTISQVQQLVAEIKSVIGRNDVLIAIDQEGGRVSRLANLDIGNFASAESLGRVDVKYSKIHAKLISQHLRELGINVNYSPVVDKIYFPQSPVLKTRCFSSNMRKIVSRATEMADAYIRQGICPCIKHIPGHFNTIIDPHLNLLKSNKSQKEILKDITYLRAFSNYPMLMTSHIILENIDNKNPTSYSHRIISEIIRDYIGFDGFLISDAIDMHALTGDIEQKAKMCIDAGCDAICYCAGIYDEMEAICQQNIFMSDKTLNRFDKIKNIINNKPRRENINILKDKYIQKLECYLDEKYSYDATEVLHCMQQKRRQ